MKQKKFPVWAIFLIVLGVIQIILTFLLVPFITYAIENYLAMNSIEESESTDGESDCFHEYVFDKVIEEPTCHTVGKELWVCQKCGETECFYSTVTKHSYVDGSCEYCGIEEPVQMGTYYWGYDEDVKPVMDTIEWDILAIEDGKALLISRYALDCMEMGEWWRGGWKNSTLRNWLNDDFYNQAFSTAEKQKILTTVIHDESTNRTTKDKIFLLSESELNQFYLREEDRVCFRTPYLAKKLLIDTEQAAWWLRDYDGESAMNLYGCVASSGEIQNVIGTDLWDVRPAMWVEWTED